FGKVVVARSERATLWLLLPEDGGSLDAVGFDEAGGTPRAFDLASGGERACSWSGEGAKSLQLHGGAAGRLDAPLVVIETGPGSAVGLS
ncbi:MAG: hypothetical protein WD990_09805, partial [Acidimicrobiia bacterium]